MKEFHYFWRVFCKLDMTWERKACQLLFVEYMRHGLIRTDFLIEN